jgi:hypothetical protein
MRTLHIITGAALVALFVIGCSKSTRPPPEITMPTNVAEAIEFSTNTLDVLQVEYQNEEKQIQDVQNWLDLLRKSGKTKDKQYLDEQRTLNNMIGFHKLLGGRIEADKLEQQHKAQEPTPTAP